MLSFVTVTQNIKITLLLICGRDFSFQNVSRLRMRQNSAKWNGTGELMIFDSVYIDVVPPPNKKHRHWFHSCLFQDRYYKDLHGIRRVVKLTHSPLSWNPTATNFMNLSTYICINMWMLHCLYYKNIFRWIISFHLEIILLCFSVSLMAIIVLCLFDKWKKVHGQLNKNAYFVQKIKKTYADQMQILLKVNVHMYVHTLFGKIKWNKKMLTFPRSTDLISYKSLPLSKRFLSPTKFMVKTWDFIYLTRVNAIWIIVTYFFPTHQDLSWFGVGVLSLNCQRHFHCFEWNEKFIQSTSDSWKVFNVNLSTFLGKKWIIYKKKQDNWPSRTFELFLVKSTFIIRIFKGTIMNMHGLFCVYLYGYLKLLYEYMF